jgi:putative membrane protein
LDSVRKLTIGFWVVGAGFIALLVYLADIDQVVQSVAFIGWGVALVVMVRVLVLVVDSQSWRCLLERDTRLGLREATVQRWVGESVSTMLPFAAIGGELARVRVSMLSGMTGALAFASIIMDGVVALASQFIFLCLGIALFAQTAAGTETVNQSILVGSAAMLIAVVLLWMPIRGGALGRLANILKADLSNDQVLGFADAMGSVDRHITEIADQSAAMTKSVIWRLLGWLLGSAEIWLILYLVGHPISIAGALVLDSLTAVVRTAFFFVPGGLVVQEGAMLAVGAALGASGDAILIAAVIKRAREIFFSIPGLLAWELLETKRLNRSSAKG